MRPERIAELRKRAERFLSEGDAAGISLEVSVPSAELLDLLATAEREAKLRELLGEAASRLEWSLSERDIALTKEIYAALESKGGDS